MTKAIPYGVGMALGVVGYAALQQSTPYYMMLFLVLLVGVIAAEKRITQTALPPMRARVATVPDIPVQGSDGRITQPMRAAVPPPLPCPPYCTHNGKVRGCRKVWVN